MWTSPLLCSRRVEASKVEEWKCDFDGVCELGGERGECARLLQDAPCPIPHLDPPC